MKSLERLFALFAGLLFTTASFADEGPIYLDDSSVLKVPSVGTTDKPGFYQNVIVEFVKEDMWRLIGAEEGIEIEEIEYVEAIRTESFPVQVFLKVAGRFTNGCQEIGQIDHRLVDNAFDIFIYYEHNRWLRNPADVACTEAIRPFTKIIPLPVYSLDAGNYEYSVNGEYKGSFGLQNSNTLQ